ncbi:TetR/AcrR family transcriptional regulator [Nocardioides campestrisoli]|uniref:TetR/AcrR family transcriptional regulator n=1 Tax=Nocardioides campestrisoli TaxID=2736757 RepID=UPI00163DC62B|nr:TetR/AcrR family transcriptional regulator [Nocardioides campestrisoli]
MTTNRRRSTGSKAGVARKEAILRSATRVFAEKGFAAATVRDIADEAEMLSGSLYYYFDSKESIIEEIVVGYLKPLVSAYHAARDAAGGPVDQLEALVGVALNSLVGNREELMILHNEWAHVRSMPGIVELQAQVDQLWMNAIQEGMNAGDLRDEFPPRLVYRTMMGALESVIRWFDPSGPSSIEQITKLQTTLMLDGLRAPR